MKALQRWRVLAAIGAIFTLEVIAILNGIDGTCFGIAIAAIAGLGGFSLAQLKR